MRVSLGQWQSLISVVDTGGYAQAAEALNKSQSSVTYAIKTLERILDVQVFERVGRRSELTPAGRTLVARARRLIDDAARIEAAASRVSTGWEAELGVAVEILFPTVPLLDALASFGKDSPHTIVEVYETVLGGASEALLSGEVAMAITPHIPTGFLGKPIMQVRFVPVANPQHPLHHETTPLSTRDLIQHRHIVVRESSRDRLTPSRLAAEQRWTVSTMATSIGAVCRGHGYAWFPEFKIVDELANDELRILPLPGGNERFVTLYLVLADPEFAGPGVKRLADIFEASCDALADKASATFW